MASGTDIGGERELAFISDADALRDEIISDLGAEDFLLRDAERAVQQTFNPGEDYTANYQRALETLTRWRREQVPVKVETPIRKVQQSKVGALQRATAPSIVSDPRGKAGAPAPRRNAEEQVHSSLTSQRPGTPVAPAAEGAGDRAHRPDSSGAARSPSAAPTQPPTRKETIMAKICGAPGCGKKLQDRNESGYCGKHFNLSRYSGGEPGRVCSVNGCETKLRRDNKTGVCRPHSKDMPARRSEPAAPAKRGRPRNPTDTLPQQKNGQTTPLHAMAPVAIAANGNGREHKVVCQISELSMDRIWSRLTPEEKAQLLWPPEEPQHA